MVKRVNCKKHLFPRFVDFKEAAKLTYDLCVSYFAATLTRYFRMSAFAFSRGFFLNELLYLLSGMILFIPVTKKLFFECFFFLFVCFLFVCVFVFFI